MTMWNTQAGEPIYGQGKNEEDGWIISMVDEPFEQIRTAFLFDQ